MKFFVLLSIFLISSCAAQMVSESMRGGVGDKRRNLILNEQEIRFAGHALRSVLSGNAMGYQRGGGPRNKRYTGTFTIIEMGDRCGDLEIRINADVETLTRNGQQKFGLAAGVQPGGGYAGNFNY